LSTKNAMELIRKLRSPDNKSVLEAIEELRAHGWLSGNALEGINLRYIHLRNADLHRANFQNADLGMADLREADLSLANLQGAQLGRANLYRADLSKTNLANVDLAKADLNRASNLTFEQLMQVKQLRGAIMPDGRRYDGRLQLPADLEAARVTQVNLDDAEAMAAFYNVTVEEYQHGQEWAQIYAGVESKRTVDPDTQSHNLRKQAS